MLSIWTSLKIGRLVKGEYMNTWLDNPSKTSLVDGKSQK